MFHLHCTIMMESSDQKDQQLPSSLLGYEELGQAVKLLELSI
jgi:hypothetical protein